MKKMFLLIWIYLLFVGLSACVNQVEEIPTSIPPTPILSFTDTPSPTPTTTLAPFSGRYELVFLNKPPENSGFPLPELGKNGGVIYYGRGVLGPDEIYGFGDVFVYYSPTFEHFLLIVHQIEEQNRVYLRSTAKFGLVRNITGENWGSVYGTKIGWSPDGKSFVYFRSACCMDIHIEIAEGLVRYDIETGDRELLVNIFPRLSPTWSLDGKWIAVLDNYSCDLDLISPDGETIQVLDDTCYRAIRWKNIEWKPASVPGKMLLILSGEQNGRIVERRYLVEMEVSK